MDDFYVEAILCENSGIRFGRITQYLCQQLRLAYTVKKYFQEVMAESHKVKPD